VLDGLLVTSTSCRPADVLIDGEAIVAVGDSAGWTFDDRVDAAGCYVLPGGVDVHTHLEEWMEGRFAYRRQLL
jgi:dihydropyrimidinase